MPKVYPSLWQDFAAAGGGGEFRGQSVEPQVHGSFPLSFAAAGSSGETIGTEGDEQGILGPRK